MENKMNFEELRKMVKDDSFLNSVKDQIESINYIDMPNHPNQYIVVKFDDGQHVIYIDELRFDDFDSFREQVDSDQNIVDRVAGIYYAD